MTTSMFYSMIHVGVYLGGNIFPQVNINMAV